MKLIRDTCHGCLCTTVAYFVVLGWLRTALVELLGGEMDFNVSGFVVDFKFEFSLVLAIEKGLGGAGMLRGPIDSNRSFAVTSNLRIFLAACETL